ncbi:hypothetical protein MTO96_031826 [Rhipicephalus appendiculatus]
MQNQIKSLTIDRNRAVVFCHDVTKTFKANLPDDVVVDGHTLVKAKTNFNATEFHQVTEAETDSYKFPTTVSTRELASDGSSASEETSASGSARDSFAVNVKSVVAVRAIGVGHEQLVQFCAILGAPKPVHHKTFTAIGKKVHAAAMKAAAENLARARELTADDAGSTNVAVMFDGTWQKRGHKSHNGVGTAISLATGLCLDFEVLSNYCLSCSRHKALEDGEEEIWQAFHTPVCEKNTTCPAHAMETEAAIRIWKRTGLYTTPLQFTTFLSDGDSKVYTAVSELNVYEGVPVLKEDCTNHVAKRLGTVLRILKMPRGEKLKDATIHKLQGYFQVAITSNRGSVRDMYCAVWASYFHSCSRDGASSHMFRPDGDMSWCKHKRAQALGEPAPPHTPILTPSQRQGNAASLQKTDRRKAASVLHERTDAERS